MKEGKINKQRVREDDSDADFDLLFLCLSLPLLLFCCSSFDHLLPPPFHLNIVSLSVSLHRIFPLLFSPSCGGKRFQSRNAFFCIPTKRKEG